MWGVYYQKMKQGARLLWAWFKLAKAQSKRLKSPPFHTQIQQAVCFRRRFPIWKTPENKNPDDFQSGNIRKTKIRSIPIWKRAENKFQMGGLSASAYA